MSKKSKQKQKFIYEKDLDNYYALHTDAVDRLVEADEDNVPEVGEAELKQYRSSKLSKIPMWIRALFIKFWFNGAVCFFFLWGLGVLVPNALDQLVITGLAMGMVTDLLVNNVFRFIEDEPHKNDKWMMVPQKKFWTFFVNIIYAYIVLALVVMLYTAINQLLLNGQPLEEYDPFGSPFLGVEPFLFGLFYLLFDMMFIGVKDGIVEAVKKLKAAKKSKAEGQQQTADAQAPAEGQTAGEDSADKPADPQPAAEANKDAAPNASAPQPVVKVVPQGPSGSHKKHSKKK